MTGSGALWLLLAAPLAAAGLLALPGRLGSGRRSRESITLVALAAGVTGLLGVLVAWPVVGQPAWFPISLGPGDPTSGLASLPWTLAPVLIAIIFVTAAARARSRLLIGLALAHLGVEVGAAWSQLTALRPATSGSGLAIDPLSASLLAVSVLVGGLIVAYALGYEPAHLAHRGSGSGRAGRFVAWLLVFMTAMNLLVLADDVRVLVVGWEMTTLCSVMLIGFDGDPAAVTASRRALAYGLVGGIALGFAEWFAGPDARLSELVTGEGPWSPVLPLILAGCIVAAATKSALVPFHPWLLGAMVAAAPVSGLLHASAMVNAGTYLLLRLAPPIAADGALGPLLALLGGLSFAAAAVGALRQQDLKRVLAFSTISTLGLTAAAAGLGSAAAVAAGVLLLVFHAVAKALAFLSVGALEQATETRDLEALVGALRTMPRIAGPLAIAAAALALPPFGLVVAKWAIFELGARDVALVVLLAIGGAAYIALWTAVVARLVVRRPATSPPARAGGPLPLRETVPIAVLSLASIGTLVLAAPVARGLADPAGWLAFGSDPGIAAGWSVMLPGGSFAIPFVAAIFLVAIFLGALVARRIGGPAPAPYLSSAGVAAAGAFHGAMGRTRVARSGGFYWGGPRASRAGTEPAGTAGPGGLPSIAVAGGWVLIAVIVIVAALRWSVGGLLP